MTVRTQTLKRGGIMGIVMRLSTHSANSLTKKGLIYDFDCHFDLSRFLVEQPFLEVQAADPWWLPALRLLLEAEGVLCWSLEVEYSRERLTQHSSPKKGDG
jgi:hypothetical protein